MKLKGMLESHSYFTIGNFVLMTSISFGFFSTKPGPSEICSI